MAILFHILAPGNTVVGLVVFNHPCDEGKRRSSDHIALLSFFNLPSCPIFPSFTEVRSPRSRKPAAIDVYRVTVSRDCGSSRVLRECRIVKPRLFLFTLPTWSIFLGFCEISTRIKTPGRARKMRASVIRVFIYYLHLSWDGVKAESPIHTPFCIYF